MSTRLWLDQQRYDWPFKGGKTQVETGKDFIRVFEPERAEWYALAHLYQCSLNEDIPVPYVAEFVDFPELFENPPDEKAQIARKIQDEIIKHTGATTLADKQTARKFFAKLILIGSVYQFWREKQRRPTVLEIADFMGFSGPAFYRRYTRADLYKALCVACGQVQAKLPDPKGFTSVQRTNWKAKKSAYKNLQSDYSSGQLAGSTNIRRRKRVADLNARPG